MCKCYIAFWVKVRESSKTTDQNARIFCDQCMREFTGTEADTPKVRNFIAWAKLKPGKELPKS